MYVARDWIVAFHHRLSVKIQNILWITGPVYEFFAPQGVYTANICTYLLAQKVLTPTFTRIFPFVSTKKNLPLPRKFLLIHQYPPFVGEKETVLYV